MRKQAFYGIVLNGVFRDSVGMKFTSTYPRGIVLCFKTDRFFVAEKTRHPLVDQVSLAPFP